MGKSEDRLQPRVIAGAFVLAAAVLLAHLFYRVASFPLPLPWPGEFMLPAPLTGPFPTLQWLWEPIYVHRSPLIKIILYTWVHLTHWNLPWAACLTACFYAVAGFAVMGSVYRRRRVLHWRDLALLLVLFSPLQMPNIVSMLQLQFVIPYFLFVTWFSMLWASDACGNARALLLSLPLILLAPLGSAFGFILGLAAALWVGGDMLFLQAPASRRVVVRVAVAGACMAAYYAVCGTWGILEAQHQWSEHLFASRTGGHLTAVDKVLNGLSFFALPFGSTVAKTQGVWLGPVMLAGIAAVAAGLFLRILRDRRDAHCASLVLCVLAAEVLAGMAIGYGKDAGTHYRYFTLVTPLPIALYLAADVLRGNAARVVAVAATGILIIGAAGTFRDAYKFQGDRSKLHRELVAWINEGADFARVPEDKNGLRCMFWPNPESYLDNLALLQNKRMAYFANKWMLLGLREQDDLNGWHASPAECLLKSPLERVSGTWVHTRDCPSDVAVRIESPPFLIETDYVQIRTFGGSPRKLLKVELLDSAGNALAAVEPSEGGAHYHFLDARAARGNIARLRLCDDDPEGFVGVGSVYASKAAAL